MEHRQIYFQIIMDEMNSIMQQLDITNNKELGEVAHNTIFNLDGPKAVEKPPNDKAKFIGQKIFRGFSEIHTTLDRINNIKQYTQRFPYRKRKISEVDYLKYHIENYLNEMYILKERMKSYNTLITRAYAKSDNANDIKQALDSSSTYVSSSFKGIVATRGNHVHSSRYSDEKLDRLSTLELLSKHGGKDRQVYKTLFDNAYKETRKSWVQQMNSNQTGLIFVLNNYCEILLKNITDQKHLIYPTNTSW